MKKNISRNDRVARIVMAVLLTGLNLSVIVYWPESILVWIGAGIMIVTAIVGSCPMYSLFGINTLSRKRTVS